MFFKLGFTYTTKSDVMVFVKSKCEKHIYYFKLNIHMYNMYLIKLLLENIIQHE